FIIGVICAAVFFFAFYFLNKKNIKLAWWEWLLAAIAVLFLIFAINWMGEAFAEDEPEPAITFLWTFGLAAIAFGAAAGVSYFLRNQTKE
ncbi:MAG: hypothetical protein FWF37_02080, partial [Chloroflexi bacterium]|nr:hypothetical protein [Chloroflexota bacterium]